MSDKHTGTGKRESVEEATGEKRYIRRDAEGHFTDDQVGRRTLTESRPPASRRARSARRAR